VRIKKGGKSRKKGGGDVISFFAIEIPCADNATDLTTPQGREKSKKRKEKTHHLQANSAPINYLVAGERKGELGKRENRHKRQTLRTISN